MTNQEIKTEDKTLGKSGTTPAEKKSGSSLKFILVLFFLAFLGTGAYWLYQQAQPYITGMLSVPESMNLTTPPNKVISTSVEPYEDEQPEVIVSLLPPLVADANEVANPALSTELWQSPAPAAAALPKQNDRIFILYMAARDLRDSIDAPERFNKELAFVRVVSVDYPELQSKIELLEIAASSGIPTRASLLDDLALLQERIRNKNHGSFVANVQNSLSKLIVISKIEGEVRSDDFNSIIKRAEIAIENDDLVKAGQELAKLGPDAKDVSDKISNLGNMRELTEYVVDFAKAKIASE